MNADEGSDGHQSLGLLRAEIDALEIAHLDLVLARLLQGAEDKKEVPDVDAHLHAVGVVFAVLGGIDELDVGLSWEGHGGILTDRATW